MRKYGWKKDLPDVRDAVFGLSSLVEPQGLPSVVDLRPEMPPVYDQGDIGSCVSNSVAGALQYLEKKQQNNDQQMPSRLFIYFNGRVIENTTGSDSGLSCRDGIKSVAQNGFCDETSWPYVEQALLVKPPPLAYTLAKKEVITWYASVPQNLASVQEALASGNPVIFGVVLYPSFEGPTVANTGMVQMPSLGETPLGGHCMLIVGYNNATQHFIVRNSWGATWALQGYCMVPYAYLMKPSYASDFWVLNFVPRT